MCCNYHGKYSTRIVFFFLRNRVRAKWPLCGMESVRYNTAHMSHPHTDANTLRKVVFDIETSNVFQDVGSGDPAALDLAMVCVHDSQSDAYTSYTQAQLGELWPIIEHADLLIGYNSDHFDIPLLNKYYPGDLAQIKSVDLLIEVKKALGRRLKLDTIAEATLGARKTADGLTALRWWRAGEYDKVRQYCMEDVRITKELYDYALTHKHLKYKDAGALKEIKLDPSRWEIKADKAMTHTLPF